MLHGQDIVLCAFADWHASWTTPQQTASRLAPHNRVLYVDEPRSFLHGRKKDRRSDWKGPHLKQVQPNLWVLHLPDRFLPVGGLPLGLSKLALAGNGHLIARHIRAAAATLNFRDPILWNMSPLHGTALEHVPGSVLVYEVPDVWGNYLTDPRGQGVVHWAERRLFRDAGVVIVGTSSIRDLWQNEYGVDREMHIVLQGADIDHFAKALAEDTPVPDDIASIPRPIIGAIGVMDAGRFDSELIQTLATNRPDWSIVLVGPARPELDLAPLKALRNVHLLGNRSIPDLPGYLKGMDVTIIPYKVNDITKYLFPLKVSEYLASGRPIVAPNMPPLAHLGGVIAIAPSHDAFLAAIDDALAHESPARFHARQAVARTSSWDQRVEEKCGLITRAMTNPMSPLESASAQKV